MIAIFQGTTAKLYDVPRNCKLFRNTLKIVVSNSVDTNVDCFKFVLDYVMTGTIPTSPDIFNKMYNLLVYLNIPFDIDKFNLEWKLHIISISDNQSLKKNIFMNILNNDETFINPTGDSRLVDICSPA